MSSATDELRTIAARAVRTGPLLNGRGDLSPQAVETETPRLAAKRDSARPNNAGTDGDCLHANGVACRVRLESKVDIRRVRRPSATRFPSSSVTLVNIIALTDLGAP